MQKQSTLHLPFYQALPWRVKLMRWRCMYAEIQR